MPAIGQADTQFVALRINPVECRIAAAALQRFHRVDPVESLKAYGAKQQFHWAYPME
jgi:hypothetical protein